MNHSPTLDSIRSRVKHRECIICDGPLFDHHEQTGGCCVWCNDEVVRGIKPPDFELYSVERGKKANRQWVNKLRRLELRQ